MLVSRHLSIIHYNRRLVAGEEIFMATSLHHFNLTLNLIGGKDAVREKSFGIMATGADDAAKRANAQTEMANIIADWKAISDTHVQSYTLSEVWYDDATTPSGLGNPYVEAIYTVGLSVGGGKTATIRVMAPKDTLFVGDSAETNQLDLSEALLSAFLDDFKVGSYGTVSDGEQFADPYNILGGRIRSVGSGKKY